MDSDGSGNFPEHELIDRFSLSIDTSITAGAPRIQSTLTGIFGLAEIELSYTLTCLDFFFGPNCSTFCDVDDCSPGFTRELSTTTVSSSTDDGASDVTQTFNYRTIAIPVVVILILALAVSLIIVVVLHFRRRSAKSSETVTYTSGATSSGADNVTINVSFFSIVNHAYIQ